MKSVGKVAAGRWKGESYRCQFCGEVSPRKDWLDDACPKCKRKYDALLAQDSEDD